MEQKQFESSVFENIGVFFKFWFFRFEMRKIPRSQKEDYLNYNTQKKDYLLIYSSHSIYSGTQWFAKQ